MAVFVLDKHHKPLMPCTEKRARLLLEKKRARVHRLLPFTIRLVDRHVSDCVLQPLRVKIDPGSKTTGIALVREKDDGGQAVLNLFELVHRARQISESMKQRSNYRRRRRSANLRYRAKRFDNRARADGWLAPCLKHRVESILNWVARIQKLAPIAGLSMELVRFDMQAMQDPEIHGVEYQQGELAGYELKEYLLEKWGRKCVYCDKENVPLNIDHIQARAKGGSNRVSNLTLACVRCNQKKGKKDVRDFVKDPDRLSRILAYAKKPLQDAAAVNSTRNALHRALQATGFPVETGSGAKTKWNRSNLSIPKTHALDAACVGSVPSLSDWQRPSLQVKCAGRGRYGRTKPNKYGFPKGYFTKNKKIHGFQSGDHVRATVPTGKKTGIHTGKVSIRASGSFNINTPAGLVQSINHKYCTLIQRADGYGYLIVPLSMEKVKGKGTKQRLAQQAALSRP